MHGFLRDAVLLMRMPGSLPLAGRTVLIVLFAYLTVIARLLWEGSAAVSSVGRLDRC